MLDGDGRAELERQALPEFLRRQRWYAGKARSLESARIVEAARPQDFPEGTLFFLVEVRYGDGASDTYFIPARLAGGPEAERLARESPGRVIARFGGGKGQRVLYDGMADPEVCQAMLDAIADERVLRGESGEIRAVRTAQFDEARGPAGARLDVILGKAEQSNTAVMFGRRLILKAFRRVEPGINPDFEIGRFLGERTDFDRVPKVAGAVEFHRGGAEPTSLAILQQLVPNQGNGWEHALDELKGYYQRAAAKEPTGELALDPAASYLEMADREPPSAVLELIGAYTKAAAQLGRRTAELHRALASDSKDAAFTPEPISRGDLEALSSAGRRRVRSALGVLKDHLDQLDSDTAKTARRVLDGGDRLRERIRPLPEIKASVVKTRVHGDYHLGQVLRSDDDFIILDFEGEPARSVEERREKRSPLKDVVGMLRSFDYAAYAALFDFVKDRPGDFARLEPWAKLWRAWTCAIFWREYREASGKAPYLPDDAGALRLLLDANTLDKILYELLYELNNRPDWVRIPLQGIAALVDRSPSPTAAEPTEPVSSRLSDFDLYLLAEGTHYRSYERLGAHVSERRGTRGVDFAVWAPNAEAVSVVGEFNGWDVLANPMEPRGESGIWERFIPGVEPGRSTAIRSSLGARASGLRRPTPTDSTPSSGRARRRAYGTSRDTNGATATGWPPAPGRSAGRPDVDLRGASGLVDARTRRRQSLALLSRGLAQARRLRAGDGFHARRAAPRRRAPIRRLLGLRADRTLCPDQPAGHAG